MSAVVDLSGLDEIVALVGRFAAPDPAPLLARLSGIMEEDNRAGLMAGLDKDGLPLRPIDPASRARGRKGSRSPGGFAGGGPPLVPRGEFSRAIRNYEVKAEPFGAGGTFVLAGSWRDAAFLRHHAEGVRYKNGRVIRRDVMGIRPAGVARMLEAVGEWAMGELERGV